MAINDHVVRYHEHVGAKSCEQLVAHFEAVVVDAESGEFHRAFQAAAGAGSPERSREAWETACASLFGPSGFMHVFSLDHGTLLGWYGVSAKAKMWIYGNPVVAAAMLTHDLRVAGRCRS